MGALCSDSEGHVITVSQILYSTTFSEDTQFKADSKNQIDVDKSSKEERIDNFVSYNFDKEAKKKLSDQDFEKV